MASAWRLVWGHRGAKWIFIGWSGFIAENLVLSENREALVASFGEENYRNTYGTLSTIACASIAEGLSFFGLQAMGLVGISQSLPKLQVPVWFDTSLPPSNPSQTNKLPSAPSTNPGLSFKMYCPIDFTYEKNKPNEHSKLGLRRVTRHPQLFSLGLFALGTSLATPFLPLRVLAAFPIIFALIGGAHQDFRFTRSGAYSQEYLAETTLLPFAALLSKKQEWGVLASELKWVNASVGIFAALWLLRRRGRLPITTKNVIN